MAKHAFNRVRAPNRPMHDRWKGRKREDMLFIFAMTADGLGRAFLILRFDGCQSDTCLLLVLLVPDPFEFSHHLLLLAFGNSAHDGALLVNQPPTCCATR